MHLYKDIFEIVSKPNVMIAVIQKGTIQTIDVGNTKYGYKKKIQRNITKHTRHKPTIDKRDTPRCIWDATGEYKVTSLYKVITMIGENGKHYEIIWKNNASFRVRAFIWLLNKEVIHTFNKLQKRVGKDLDSVVCNKCEENLNHIFFKCDFTTYIWECMSTEGKGLQGQNQSERQLTFGVWERGDDHKREEINNQMHTYYSCVEYLAGKKQKHIQ